MHQILDSQCICAYNVSMVLMQVDCCIHVHVSRDWFLSLGIQWPRNTTASVEVRCEHVVNDGYCDVSKVLSYSCR